MSIEPNDPRLTAHALSELDADEAETFETELDDAARLEIEEIKKVASLLERELSADEPALSSEQRQRIERALAPEEKQPAPVVQLPRRRRAWLWAIAAAVPFVLAVGSLTVGRKMSVPASLVDGKDREEKAEFLPPAASAMATSAAPEMKADMKSKRGLGLADEGPGQEPSTNAFDSFEDNPFVRVAVNPRSTFSIDVDTASYAVVRSLLRDGQLPPKGAVRIEELINYFSYSYPEPKPGGLFTVSTEVSQAPWATSHRLVRIGIKGKDIPMAQRPASNLVFLLDVSGSMEAPNKLPLLKRAFRLLVEQLDERDHVSIVVYAGASGVVLPPTAANRQSEILGALDRLDAGGSTNGGEGIQLAYEMAQKSFARGGTNRVILATDGDFNVGVSNQSDLVDLIEKKAKSGVFLSVLGFGMGNYKDSSLEKLADKGNGNYAYIDDIGEARKVLVEQGAGTLVTIAKDVKIQVEFNPREVAAFRLIGYENRVMAHQDFNDDKKDAGDIGAGHTVTALYEIVPAGQKVPGPGVDGLKYQAPPAASASPANAGELMTVKLRYKLPEGDTSRLLEMTVADSKKPVTEASTDFRFAAAVASFGMLLRSSPHKGDASYASVLSLSEGALGNGRDRDLRQELVTLVRTAQRLSGR